MCRLFGFRSVIPSQVHRSLVAADNALAKQSERHPDGWGVAYYVDGAPHVTKSAAGAMDDALFRRVSGVVSSETVVAHIRKATQGNLTVLNSHPFQYGRWVMAHNGDIPNFASRREQLEALIAPRLRRFILGETDSERVFFLFLTELTRFGDLSGRFGLEEVVPALAATVRTVREVTDDAAAGVKSLLTLLITNGQCMVAHQGGKELYYSTWKRRCADRDICPSLAKACESPIGAGGSVNHLLIASEPLQGDNVWEPLAEGEIVGVDWRMRLLREPGQRP
jgi:glutamine amidotransferase